MSSLHWSKLGIVNQYFTSLLGYGYGSQKEKSISNILVISSVFLSLASGYTTYMGLYEYVPIPIAFLIALAIQGLLFATSWKIGSSLSSGQFNQWLIFIYLISLTSSVFFSYSSLLDRIYTEERRESDKLKNAQLNCQSIISSLVDDLQKVNATRGDSLRNDISHLLSQSSQSISQANSRYENELRQKQAEANALKEKADLELSKGGTKVYRNGVVTYSPKGHGPIYDRFNADYIRYRDVILAPALLKKQMLDSLNQKHNELQSKLFTTESIPTVEDIKSYEWVHSSLQNTLNLDQTSIINQTDFGKIISGLSELSLNAAFMEKYGLEENLARFTSVKELKTQTMKIVSQAPVSIPSSKKWDLQQIIKNIGRLEGKEAHYFELSIGELNNQNLLAYGALLIAIIIDILILLCGIMGARPNSFLDMNRVDDLREIKDLALNLTLGFDYRIKGKSTSRVVNRIIEIMESSTPSLESAMDGLPAIITDSKIKQLKMERELGVLLAFELAEPLPGGSVGLRTKFILWASEQVSADSDVSETSQNLKEMLEGV